MNLPDYIKQVGPSRFAKLLRVKKRTAESWMRLERYPRPEKAKEIVEKTPITMDGIYGR